MNNMENGGIPYADTSAGQSADLANEAKSPNHETLDWDAKISGDAQPNTLFPEGDYTFKVIELNRERSAGTAKIPPCNKAAMKLRLKKDDGQTKDIKADLFLVKMMEWKLTAFFRSIGLMKKGQEFRMDWSKVVGAEGRAHIKQRTFRGNDGKDHTVNEVEKYLDPVETTDKTTIFDPGPDRNY